MRTVNLLLVLAPFALAAACGGKKPAMEDPAVPTTPDMSMDSGALANAMDSSAPSDMPTPTTTDTADAAPPAPPAAPVDAGAPDAGKGGKGGGKKGGGGGGKPKKN